MKYEEVKLKTLDLLGSDNLEDVEYITEEMVLRDNESHYDEDGIGDSNKLIVDEIHGHNMRYYYQNEEYGYAYERGSSITGEGCGNTYSKWLPFSKWEHDKIGDCTSSDALLRFTPREEYLKILE